MTSPVDVVEIDRYDDDVLLAYWDAGREADQHERPFATYWPYRAAKVALRGSDPTWRIVPLAAIRDGDVLGQSQILLPQRDNTHLAYTQPLVRPGQLGEGVEDALLDAVLDRCRDEGRSTLMVEATRPIGSETSPGWEFLTRRGFDVGLTDVHRVLRLPIDDARLATLARRSAAQHADYTLVSCQDGIPQQYVDGFCRLQMAFNDEAPMGELDIEPEVWTAERLRANEQRRADQGTWSETSMAVTKDGSLAGLSELTVTGEGRGHCLQGSTLVLREHRGHRLGMALKVLNLRSLQSRELQVAMVHSWNAEENAHMAAINTELGFEPVEEVGEFQCSI